MEFEFTITPAFNFVKAFADRFDIPVFNDCIVIPAALGNGIIKKIDIEPCFKLIINNYKLKQDFYLKCLPCQCSSDFISIVFNGSVIPTDCPKYKEKALMFLRKNGSTVQIFSSMLGMEAFFPKDSEVRYVAIKIKRSVLISILKIKNGNCVTQKILDGTKTFYFNEQISLEENKIIRQLSMIKGNGELSNLSYRIKAEELLHILFSKLLVRETAVVSNIGNSEITQLFKVRDAIVTDLSIQPDLIALSKMTAMSEYKMKQLFKQVFGNSVYEFYQKERMQEAAFLIRQAGYSVSEAGYHLGFTNLSHFGRLFKKHYGFAPKKYSSLS